MNTNSRKKTTRILTIGGRKFRRGIPSFITYPLVVLLSTVTMVVFFFPFHTTVQSYDLPKVGEAAKETIIAPFTFDIRRSEDELERERKRAMDQVLMVLDHDQGVAAEVVEKIQNVKSKILLYKDPATADSLREQLYRQIARELPERAIQNLMKRPVLLDEAVQQASFVLETGVASVLLISGPEQLAELRAKYNTNFDHTLHYDKRFVSLRRDDSEMVISISEIPVKEIALEQVVNRLKRDRNMDDEALTSIYEILYAYVRPNIRVNGALTTKRRNEAAQGVLEISGKVIRDTEVVRRHQEVTPEVVQKIRSLHKALDRLENVEQARRVRAANLGRLMFVLIPLLFVAFYIKNYEPDIMKSNKMLSALALCLVFQVVVIRAALFIIPKLFQEGVYDPAIIPELIIPFSLGAILSAILFDLRISLIVSLFSAVFISVVMGFNHFFFVYAFLGSLVSSLFTHHIRYRWHFFKAIPPVTLICMVMIAFWHLVGYKIALVPLAQNFMLAFISIVGSMFFAMILTPIFEMLFDICTDMTLVELSDMNHPILKRLSIEAAGTYNHSVLVGNLAESAAQRVGANALLARVASYYHDIGKIEKSDYFVENNMHGERNRHTKLTPNMSALVISSHVKDGVELAKKHKLPRVIQDVIKQHHGTSTVSFFYEKALELDPHKQVQEKDFRYPGPSPQTREIAIIMLADSVEAASRSIASSSPKLLRELVKKIIRDKFLASQLDECNLTQRDLHEIVEGFMPVLQGIFHTRIEYPNKKRGVFLND